MQQLRKQGSPFCFNSELVGGDFQELRNRFVGIFTCGGVVE